MSSLRAPPARSPRANRPILLREQDGLWRLLCKPADQDVLEDGERPVNVDALEDEPDLLANGAEGPSINHAPSDGDRAQGRLDEPIQTAQQGRFARAAGTKYDHELANSDPERQTPEHPMAAEGFREIGHLDHRIARLPASPAEQTVKLTKLPREPGVAFLKLP